MKNLPLVFIFDFISKDTIQAQESCESWHQDQLRNDRFHRLLRPPPRNRIPYDNQSALIKKKTKSLRNKHYCLLQANLARKYQLGYQKGKKTRQTCLHYPLPCTPATTSKSLSPYILSIKTHHLYILIPHGEPA